MNFAPFDNSPFRPCDVKSTLARSNKKSAPGPDGISFSVLHKLESTHHILATYFNKVFTFGLPPPSWGESVIKLVHKKGPADDPSNFRMIALSGCIGKTFHLLLADRLTKYLTVNNLIDPTMQKAFLPGINGCIEHNMVLDELIKDARVNKRTLHGTFFDLADAFGSVPHALIDMTLRRNFLPENIVAYFTQIYKNSQAVVSTKSWNTNPFVFRRGVFQGDPISPIIFLMVFNPILLDLKNKAESVGYKLGDYSYVTLPYADDFCLITTNLKTHQRLISDISDKITSMGMMLKPSKCRSVSISSGKSKVVPFFIGDFQIPSIRDEEQKFLGKLLFFSGKAEETFSHIKDIFVEAMDNIENAMIRDEYKLWIYKEYLLPSKRFLLTVHTLTKTHLQALDTLTDKHIKKWSGLPRSATNALIHMKEGMDVKSISELYMEAHCVSHARTRLLGDSSVNNVINCILARESSLTTKKCTTTEVEASFNSVLQLNTVQGEIPHFTGERAATLQHQFNSEVRSTLKKHIQSSHDTVWRDHVKSLTVQGNTLALAAAEECDLSWKSYMFGLKQGTLKFILNASIDTLPSQANLKRWKKSTSDMCPLCRGRQTTNHVLNICPIGKDTGRWTWRHNNVVNYIVSCVDKEKYTVYSDLPGHTAAGGGSIPPEICITVQKPDIVIIDKSSKDVHLFELTCPLETNIDLRHQDKCDKYAHFVTDCSSANSKCTVTCFEVSSRGLITPRNHDHLSNLHKFTQKGVKMSMFKKNISALSVLSSYHIWLCRSDPTFQEPPFLPPPFQETNKEMPTRTAGR